MKAEVTITVTKEGHVLKATNTFLQIQSSTTPSHLQVFLKLNSSSLNVFEGKAKGDLMHSNYLENGNVVQNQEKMQQMDHHI